jgi:hypothetical protein
MKEMQPVMPRLALPLFAHSMKTGIYCLLSPFAAGITAVVQAVLSGGNEYDEVSM